MCQNLHLIKKILSSVILLKVTLGVIYIYIYIHIYRFSVLGFIFPFWWWYVFSRTVEPAPGVDVEGLEVATECLTEAFKLDSSSVNDHTNPDSLVDIFRSLERTENQEIITDSAHGAISGDAPSSSSAQNAANAKLTEVSNSLVCSSSFVYKTHAHRWANYYIKVWP